MQTPALLALQKAESCIAELSSCWQLLHCELVSLQADYDRLVSSSCDRDQATNVSIALQSTANFRFPVPQLTDAGKSATQPSGGDEPSTALLEAWKTDVDQGSGSQAQTYPELVHANIPRPLTLQGVEACDAVKPCILHRILLQNGEQSYGVDQVEEVLQQLAHIAPAIQKNRQGNSNADGSKSEFTYISFLKVLVSPQTYSQLPDQKSVEIARVLRQLLFFDVKHGQVKRKCDSNREEASDAVQRAARHALLVASPPIVERPRRTILGLSIDVSLCANFDNLLDFIVAIVIISNVIVLGVSTVNIDWPGWDWFDQIFAIFYTMEMFLKLWRHGCKMHFCGPQRWWNWFDACLVLIAVMDAFFSDMLTYSEKGNYIQVVKVARIGRLARLIRLLRYDSCAELSMMLIRLNLGLKSLQGALVLLFFTVWSLAVLLAMTIGSNPDDPRFPPAFDVEQRQQLFSNTFRAGFTVFRCITGDCSTPGGQPLAPVMTEAFGALFAVPYICTILVATFGILNLVMAVFVERTLEASNTLNSPRPSTGIHRSVAAAPNSS